MEYILNHTPLKTSNNYGINNIKLDINIPTVRNYDNFLIMSTEVDKLEIINLDVIKENKNLTSKIGIEVKQNYGIDIIVPKKVEMKEPIILEFNLDEDSIALVENINIVYEENAKADFIIKYISIDDDEQFHYLKQITKASSNSKGSITIINMLNENSNSFIAIENNIEDNANIEYNLIELGGKNKISNYYAKLKGNMSKNVVKNVYVGNNNNIIDINYNIEIYGQNAKCKIESQGAIKDNCKKNFKGTIDFKEGAKKSTGSENENCILLSNTARAKSLPMLLCHEEDVEGEHGVSSGKIDDDKLFYIMTRGISINEAKRLIIKAHFSDIIKNIKDENTQSEIENKVDKLLQ